MINTFIEGVKNCNDGTEFIIVVTGDHTTPTQVGDHTFEPVPILMSLVSNFLGNNKNDLE